MLARVLRQTLEDSNISRFDLGQVGDGVRATLQRRSFGCGGAVQA